MNNLMSFLQRCLHEQMQVFPFHNLTLLNRQQAVVGGTCFDQALKLKDTLNQARLCSRLCEAEVCMTGELTHRLVRVDYQGSALFVDAGSGWPTVYVARPAAMNQEHQVLHKVAGIVFQIMADSEHILIKRHDGTQWRDMNRISLAEQDELDILAKYDSRYASPLPFSKELRLCWLENARFYRVAGNHIFVFETGKRTKCCAVSPQELIRQVSKTKFMRLVPDLERHFEGQH
ncbi:arylamine N-acetyltransferase [Spongorhabdus nitratireducens]